MNFNLKRPCANCPFRSDIDFFLYPVRRHEIAKSLVGDSTFACHKTVDYSQGWDGEDRTYTYNGNEEHCAGALISLVKSNALYSNFLFRLAFLAGLFDPAKLDLDSPVLTLEQFIHKEDQPDE